MKKVGYRIDTYGYYVPQYTNGKNEWIDVKIKHLGNGELLNIAKSLGERRRWDILFHYSPKKDENVSEMSLIFKNILRVNAFLGALKTSINNYDQTIEFEL